MDGDDAVRIIEEETLGVPPERPDTPEEARYRARVSEDVRQAKEAGYVIQVPTEMPSGEDVG